MASIIGVETLQHTNGTTAATIDSSGNVTLTNPYELTNPVAFEAYLSANETGFDTTATGDSVAWNATNYNHGSHFKTSGADIGLFVVPFDGIYSFDCWVYSNVDSWSQLWLTINGNRMAYSDVHVGSANANFVGGNWNKKFDAGDKIGVHPYNGGTSEQINSNNNHTYFRGHLVHKL